MYVNAAKCTAMHKNALGHKPHAFRAQTTRVPRGPRRAPDGCEAGRLHPPPPSPTACNGPTSKHFSLTHPAAPIHPPSTAPSPDASSSTLYRNLSSRVPSCSIFKCASFWSWEFSLYKSKWARKLGVKAFFTAYWRHRKPPLRGGQLR